MAFKAEFGHCNVPQRRSRNDKHYSLGRWCDNLRQSYKAIKDGRSSTTKLSKANMKRLEKAGFQWRFKWYLQTSKFMQYFNVIDTWIILQNNLIIMLLIIFMYVCYWMDSLLSCFVWVRRFEIFGRHTHLDLAKPHSFSFLLIFPKTEIFEFS